MTTRKTLFVDRVASLLLALVLLAGGAGAVYWWTGRSTLATTVDTGGAADLVAAAWWPWASAAVGLVLVLVGLRWILAHLDRQRVQRLPLAGSSAEGRLEVLAGKVAGAAADAYADTVGVRSARGVVVRDRGQLVARISAVIEPESDLATLARHADEVSAQLAEVLQSRDVRCSVQLRVATLPRSLSRVS